MSPLRSTDSVVVLVPPEVSVTVPLPLPLLLERSDRNAMAVQVRVVPGASVNPLHKLLSLPACNVPALAVTALLASPVLFASRSVPGPFLVMPEVYVSGEEIVAVSPLLSTVTDRAEEPKGSDPSE